MFVTQVLQPQSRFGTAFEMGGHKKAASAKDKCKDKGKDKGKASGAADTAAPAKKEKPAPRSKIKSYSSGYQVGAHSKTRPLCLTEYLRL